MIDLFLETVKTITMKTTTYFLSFLLLVSLQSSAQNWLWGAKGETGLKTDLFAKNVATNKTGNAYHTGGFETMLMFGTDTLTSIFEDAYLVKYDPNGNVLWAKQSVTNPRGSTIAYSVASDDLDNSYITGTTGGNQADFGPYSLKGGTQLFLVKYSPAGGVQWAVQPSTTGNAVGYCVATDKFGHEYVTGQMWGPITFGSYTLPNSGIFLAKYDRNGKVIWAVQPGVCDSSFGYSVATDRFGNVYISGQFQEHLTFGSSALFTKYPQVFMAKYDSNGNVLWAVQSTGGCPHCPASAMPFIPYCGMTVAADNAGSSYITGAYYDSITFGKTSLHTNPINARYDIFLTKYSSTGQFVWAESADCIDKQQWGAVSISTDTLSHVYISGSCNGGNTPFKIAMGGDTFTYSGTFVNDAPSLLIQFDSSGKALCGTLEAGGGEYPNAVASDPSGNYVYLGGGFTTQLYFGPDTLNDNSAGYDTYVARWKPCGVCGMVLKVTTGKVNGPEIGCDSTAMVTVSGGTPPYTYNWSPGGATTASVSGLCTGIYCCVVKDAGGCTDSTCVNIGAVGIETISSETGFNVYPVPTSGLLHVDIYDNTFIVNSIEVLDITGRTVMTQKVNSSAHSLSINASVLEAGTYFLKLTSATGQKTARFVIIK